MKSHPSWIDEQGEVRELTEKDFAVMQPAKEVLPTFLLRKIGIQR